MEKLYCIISGKYRKFERPEISCIFGKTLVFSIICSKSKNEDKNKKFWTTLSYIERPNLAFSVTVCISISPFASLIDISKGIMSSIIGPNLCAIIARIKKYKSIIKKKRKKHDKKALLAKTNLDCVKGSISRSLTHVLNPIVFF